MTQIQEVQQQEQEVIEEETFNGLFYRAIKFKNGEEMICGLVAADLNYTIKKYITVHSPMAVHPGAELREWSEVADTDLFEISTDMIRSMYEIKENVQYKYLDILDERYIDHLKGLLEGELDDDEREDIEAELHKLYDGSVVVPDDSPIGLYDLPVTSKLIH